MITTQLYAICLSLLFFISAYAIYGVTRYFFRRICKSREIALQVVMGLDKVFLVICLEIALFFSFALFEINTHPFVHHFWVIVFLATMGCLLTAFATVLYKLGMKKYATEDLGQIAQRSAFTQIHLIYRLGMAAIFILTLAAIFMTFPQIKSLGIGLLGSAGIAGIALGLAAKPIILNVMAGMQLAFNKILKIGDAIVIEGESATVEQMHLTYLVARTWDLRRFILPTSYFIEHPFQNWSARSSELISTVFLYCDYSVAIDPLRKKFESLLQESPYFNGNLKGLHVTSCDERSLQIRLTMSAKDAPSAFQLAAFVREKMIDFIQKEHSEAIPKQRLVNL